MTQKTEQQTPTPTSEAKPEAKTPEPAQPDNYVHLEKPLVVMDRKLDKLLIDSQELPGNEFFALVSQYRKLYPEERGARVCDKFSDENFIALVLAKLNNITPEDLYKIPFTGFASIFILASGFF